MLRGGNRIGSISLVRMRMMMMMMVVVKYVMPAMAMMAMVAIMLVIVVLEMMTSSMILKTAVLRRILHPILSSPLYTNS